MTSVPDSTVPPPRTTLLRAWGPITAMAMVVGNVIGAGIFLKPGNIAEASGNFPVILSVWILGGILCFLGALCIAELAAMLPQAGGLYVYLREAYGEGVAFLFGWSELLFVRPASVGALSMAFAGSLGLATGLTVHDWQRCLSAAVLIALLAVVNVLGVIWGGRLQLAMTVIKVAFLALVILAPLLAFPVVGPTWHFANLATHATAAQPTLPAQIGVVLLSVMWAYNGWHAITPLAEEIRAPQRTIPLALFAGIGILMLLYVSANITYHGTMTMSEVQSAEDHVAEIMLAKLAGPAGQAAMSIVIMCSTLGAVNSDLLQAPRVSYAMGRDGLLPALFADVHARFRTPVAAILATAGLAIVMIGLSAIGKAWVTEVHSESIDHELLGRIVLSLQRDSIFELLSNFVIFSASLFYMLAVGSLIVLRRKHPSWERPYRTWGYPWVPCLFLISYTWFLFQVYLTSPLESRTGLILIATGIPCYAILRRTPRFRAQAAAHQHTP